LTARELGLAAVVALGAVAALGVLKLTVFDDSGATAATPRATAPVTPEARATLPAPTPTPEPKRTYALTGLPMAPQDAPNARRRPVAVMVDNNEAAYPQVGLDRADVVIEALVEGGITRFMAVYDSHEADLVEPVRSARTPFLHWALEFDALYAHVGRAESPGPADAGTQLRDWGLADLDMEGGEHPAAEAFDRDGARFAPHNVRTNTTALRSAATARGYGRLPAVGEWRFDANAGSDSRFSPGPEVEVRFGGISTELVTWKWDAAGGAYLRFMDGEAHRDGLTHRQLGATNVIVMHARTSVVDASGHVLIDNVGQGRAEVYTGGRAITATWRKPDDPSRTRFYGADGVEVLFRPGNTWIEVVADEPATARAN